MQSLTANSPEPRVSPYLRRIGYTGPVAATLEVLRNLHRAHMFHVPFENLDIALRRKIVCDEVAFVQKIVARKRGGFCYELNGAFAWLLSTIGFRVTLLSARVPREDGTASPEFDHLALRVDLDQPWLADVGFGDSFVEPLLLQPGAEQPQGGWTYRIIDGSNSLLMERADRDGVWRPQYFFTLTPRKLRDFADMCLYHQTSPESPFTRKSVCSKSTSKGRVTVADRRLIFTYGGKKRERALTSDSEWRAVLKEHFGVVL